MPAIIPFKDVVRFFLSRRVAIALLMLMAALLFVSTRYPELAVTSSPYFLILPAFIFISISLCTVDRFMKRGQKDIGFWGSMVFHAGLLTIISAAVVTRLTLFSGELLLAEGFPAPLGREGFIKIWDEPIGGIRLPEGVIALEYFKSIYKGDFPVDHEAKVRLEMKGGTMEKTVRVNEPLMLDGLQYALNRYGFSSAFVVQSDKGEVLLDAFINLVIVDGGEDYFEVPGAGARVYVRFFPDFDMTKDGPVSKSRLPNNPVVAVKVTTLGKESKYRLIKKGETAEVMGLRISFQDLRYWAHFLVSRDRGVPVFLAGFIVGVAGLMIRFLTMQKNRAKE